MFTSVMTVALAVTTQVAPYGGGGVPPLETDISGGTYARTSLPAEVTVGYGEQLYPYDYQAPWHHNYYQEIPAYGGFNAFRPYNYKHLLAQSQAAGGWGLSPQMPYAQQFWHRYQQRALMYTQASTAPSNAVYYQTAETQPKPQGYPGINITPATPAQPQPQISPVQFKSYPELLR